VPSGKPAPKEISGGQGLLGLVELAGNGTSFAGEAWERGWVSRPRQRYSEGGPERRPRRQWAALNSRSAGMGARKRRFFDADRFRTWPSCFCARTAFLQLAGQQLLYLFRLAGQGGQGSLAGSGLGHCGSDLRAEREPPPWYRDLLADAKFQWNCWGSPMESRPLPDTRTVGGRVERVFASPAVVIRLRIAQARRGRPLPHWGGEHRTRRFRFLPARRWLVRSRGRRRSRLRASRPKVLH